MFLPERDGDKHLTLTAAVTHRFQMEAAIFGRYHFLPRQRVFDMCLNLSLEGYTKSETQRK